MAFMGLMKQIYGGLPTFASIIFSAQRPAVIAVRTPDQLASILSETFTSTSVQVPMFVPQSSPEQSAAAVPPPLVRSFAPLQTELSGITLCNGRACFVRCECSTH